MRKWHPIYFFESVIEGIIWVIVGLQERKKRQSASYDIAAEDPVDDDDNKNDGDNFDDNEEDIALTKLQEHANRSACNTKLLDDEEQY